MIQLRHSLILENCISRHIPLGLPGARVQSVAFAVSRSRVPQLWFLTAVLIAASGIPLPAHSRALPARPPLRRNHQRHLTRRYLDGSSTSSAAVPARATRTISGENGAIHRVCFATLFRKSTVNRLRRSGLGQGRGDYRFWIGQIVDREWREAPSRR